MPGGTHMDWWGRVVGWGASQGWGGGTGWDEVSSGEPKSSVCSWAVGSGGQGHGGRHGGGCTSLALPPHGPAAALRLPGEPRAGKGDGEGKLVLGVSPAGGGEEPSQRLQGYCRNSAPQTLPALPQRKPQGWAEVRSWEPPAGQALPPSPLRPVGVMVRGCLAGSRLCKAAPKRGSGGRHGQARRAQQCPAWTPPAKAAPACSGREKNKSPDVTHEVTSLWWNWNLHQSREEEEEETIF